MLVMKAKDESWTCPGEWKAMDGLGEDSSQDEDEVGMDRGRAPNPSVRLPGVSVGKMI